MEDVLAYLELKNRYYEKFLHITEKFLAGAKKNQWKGLELFIDSRDRIINIIRSFDFKIATAFEQEKLTAIVIETLRPQIKELMDRRDSLVAKIVGTDLELASVMDQLKSETIRDLKRTISLGQKIQTFTQDKDHIPVRKPIKHTA